ncbi:MAG: AtpZ/AtpI family protein [Candidatus Velthaea sp.]|jgi:hypothetical protein
MIALRIAGVGAAFVACVVAGFFVGVLLGERTGAAWWPLAGIFAGLLAGVLAAAATARRALR